MLKELPDNQSQKVLFVTGLDLLYRYQFSLSTFSQLATESCMIIFGLSALDVYFHPSTPFPDYIRFSPESLIKYLTFDIPEVAIVKEE